jgi:hypothetical protein
VLPVLLGLISNEESELMAAVVSEASEGPWVTLDEVAAGLEAHADAASVVSCNRTAVLGRNLAVRLRALVAEAAADGQAQPGGLCVFLVDERSASPQWLDPLRHGAARSEPNL